MIKYEEKFIVINKKRFKELDAIGISGRAIVKGFIDSLELLDAFCAGNNIKHDQKYYVVNQDEPYADEVFRLILDGETKKNRRSP